LAGRAAGCGQQHKRRGGGALESVAGQTGTATARERVGPPARTSCRFPLCPEARSRARPPGTAGSPKTMSTDANEIIVSLNNHIVVPGATNGKRAAGSEDFQVCRTAGFPTAAAAQNPPIGSRRHRQVWKPAPNNSLAPERRRCTRLSCSLLHVLCSMLFILVRRQYVVAFDHGGVVRHDPMRQSRW